MWDHSLPDVSNVLEPRGAACSEIARKAREAREERASAKPAALPELQRRKDATRAVHLGAMLPQNRAAQERSLEVMERTRVVLDAHPFLQASKKQERLDELHRSIDANEFGRSNRQKLMEAKRNNMAFLLQLRVAEKNMYS